MPETKLQMTRIAVPYQDGQIFQHFGHSTRFQIYDLEDGKVTIRTLVNTNGSNQGALADILKKTHVDTLICGTLGDGAKRALQKANITLYSGVTGSADAAVQALLDGTLVYDLAISCEHQGEHRNDAVK